MIKNRFLKKENILLKNLLQIKIVSLNEIIGPGFNFGIVTRKDNPKEYFASLVLNKIYSLAISMENSIIANDVFLSIYLYRYVYELHIKVSFIFSGSSEKDILFRLDEFFENKKWNLAGIINKTNTNFVPLKVLEDHKEKYEMICRFVHPNIESLKLHSNRSDDQQFEFLVPNINLTIWHAAVIIRLFSNFKILNFNTNIDQRKLELLQSTEF